MKNFKPNGALIGSRVFIYIDGKPSHTGILQAILNPHDWLVSDEVITLNDSTDVELDRGFVNLYIFNHMDD